MRNLRCGRRFEKNLRQIEKKHRGFSATAQSALEKYREDGPTPTSDRMIGVGGLPVYKERLPLPGIGKREGARIIYYCDEAQVIPYSLTPSPPKMERWWQKHRQRYGKSAYIIRMKMKKMLDN